MRLLQKYYLLIIPLQKSLSDDFEKASKIRRRIQNKSFAFTGRVVALKVEADADLHIALQGATGDKPGIVVCKDPAKPQWCSIREMVFSWTLTRFPFHTSSAKKLKLDQTPIVTVTGRAFFDVGHSLKDQKSNRRSLQVPVHPGDSPRSPVHP